VISFRRILLIALRSSEGLFTEPTTAIQVRQREPLFMPLSSHCEHHTPVIGALSKRGTKGAVRVDWAAQARETCRSAPGDWHAHSCATAGSGAMFSERYGSDLLIVWSDLGDSVPTLGLSERG